MNYKSYKQFCEDFHQARDGVGIADGPNDWEDFHWERALFFQHWSVMALAVIHEWDQREPYSLNEAFNLLGWIAMLPYTEDEAIINAKPGADINNLPNVMRSFATNHIYKMNKWTRKQLRGVLDEGISLNCYGIGNWGSFNGREAVFRLKLLPSVGMMIERELGMFESKKPNKAA